jgi:hypothetical protein
MTLLMISLLAGMVLGQRFNVVVLVPGITLALVLVVGSGIERGDTLWSIALTAVGTVVSLQVGYLLGNGIRHILLGTQTRSPANSLPGSASARRAAH